MVKRWQKSRKSVRLRDRKKKIIHKRIRLFASLTEENNNFSTAWPKTNVSNVVSHDNHRTIDENSAKRGYINGYNFHCAWLSYCNIPLSSVGVLCFLVQVQGIYYTHFILTQNFICTIHFTHLYKYFVHHPKKMKWIAFGVCSDYVTKWWLENEKEKFTIEISWQTTNKKHDSLF